MKKILIAISLVFILLSGCSSPPYSIYEQNVTSAQATIWVDVPADATNDQMASWGSEIASNHKDAPATFITFYKGGHDAEHLVGTYSDTSGFSPASNE